MTRSLLSRAGNSRLYGSATTYLPALAFPLARLAARLAFTLTGSRAARAQLRGNLRLAFKDADERSLDERARRHHTALYEAHAVLRRTSHMTGAALRHALPDIVRIEDDESLREIKRRRGPVIVTTPHYGAFALGALRLIDHVGASKRINLFFDDPRTNATTGVFVSLFEKFGGNARILLNSRRSVLEGFRALKNDELLIMMPDVYDVGGNHIMVPFMDRLAGAMTGTAFFALKTGAPVYPMYCYPSHGHRCTLDLHPAIDFHPGGDPKQDLYVLTAKIFRSMEAQFKRRPEHWIYWKTLHTRLPCRLEMPGEDWRAGFGALLDEVERMAPSLRPSLSEIALAVDRDQETARRAR